MSKKILREKDRKDRIKILEARVYLLRNLQTLLLTQVDTIGSKEPRKVDDINVDLFEWHKSKQMTNQNKLVRNNTKVVHGILMETSRELEMLVDRRATLPTKPRDFRSLKRP